MRPLPAPVAVPARADARPARAAASREAWTVGLLLAATLLATAWMRPLMLPDEGRYAGVAWEMLRSGDWLTPTLDGMPFFHKPPLFYWITAAALDLFGRHELAARAAPLLGGWLGGFSLFLFLRRWAGGPLARRALAVLVAMPLFFVGAQFANLDMLVAGCIGATVLAGAHTLLLAESGAPSQAFAAGTWALAALGVLAKGLIGLVLPGAVLLAWLLWTRRWRALPRLFAPAGPLLFAAIAAPWFLAMERLHPGFLDYFFVVQHFKRYAAGGFNNVQPAWFYPVVLALLSAPWLGWLWRGARRTDGTQGDLRRLMLAWAVVVTAFFSLPASKLLGYVLPAVPPLAALAALGLPAGPPGRGQRAAFAVSALAGLALVIGLALWPPHSARPLAQALAARHAEGEPVLSLAPYPYDLPFYAGLREPLPVLGDWSASAANQRDDWRKELADAGRFAPAVARRLLVERGELPALLCAAPVSWVVGEPYATPHELAAAERVHADHDGQLWRFERRAAPDLCPPK